MGRLRPVVPWTAILILPIVAGYFVADKELSPFSLDKPDLPSIEELSEIATIRVQVNDVVVAEDEDWKGSWLVEGDGLVSIDVDKGSVDCDAVSRRVRVTLPQPRATHCRVDHEKTKLHGFIDIAPWYRFTKDSRNSVRAEAMKKARENIAEIVGSPENVAEAQRECELLLRSLYRKYGFECEVAWIGEHDEKGVKP